MPHVDKEGSINHMSSFKELNERDEDFDSSLNSAFLNNVNLDGTDDSKSKGPFLYTQSSTIDHPNNTLTSTQKTLIITNQPSFDKYETFSPEPLSGQHS